MKTQKQGFLIRKKNNGKEKFYINHKKTNSVLLNKIQVDFLLYFKNVFHGKLLDAGCGEKPYKLIYDEMVEEQIGCDVETCVHNKESVDVIASLDNLPFTEDSFDTILCSNVLEHVENVEKAFQELERVLNVDGRLILSAPFLYPVHEAPYDFQRFTLYGLKANLKKYNLEIETILPWGGVGLMLAVYINLFLCKFLRCKLIEQISCILQEGFYFIYKKIAFNRIIKNKCKNGNIISLGYFVVAKKVDSCDLEVK